MKCPYCESKMIIGNVWGTYKGSRLDWLPQGEKPSSMDYYGDTETGIGRRSLFGFPYARAYKCDNCNKIIIDLNAIINKYSNMTLDEPFVEGMEKLNHEQIDEYLNKKNVIINEFKVDKQPFFFPNTKFFIEQLEDNFKEISASNNYAEIKRKYDSYIYPNELMVDIEKRLILEALKVKDIDSIICYFFYKLKICEIEFYFKNEEFYGGFELQTPKYYLKYNAKERTFIYKSNGIIKSEKIIPESDLGSILPKILKIFEIK